jgi:hypothetical protein
MTSRKRKAVRVSDLLTLIALVATIVGGLLTF